MKREMIENLLVAPDLHKAVGESLADFTGPEHALMSKLLHGIALDSKRTPQASAKTIYLKAANATPEELRAYVAGSGGDTAASPEALQQAQAQLSEMLRPKTGRPPTNSKTRAQQVAAGVQANRKSKREEYGASVLLWAKSETLATLNNIKVAHGLNDQHQAFELAMKTLRESGALDKSKGSK